jgi:hypothetical protein
LSARIDVPPFVYRKRFASLAAFLFAWTAVSAVPNMVGEFEAGDLTGWELKRFHGETHYALLPGGDEQCLRAQSDGTASGLVKKVRVHIEKTPYLNWSWKVESVLSGLDETTKKGDDYPARIYLVFSGGTLFWKTRALNYVWAGGQPAGTSWPNAYTSNAVMVAVESGAGKLGQWVHEKRDVRADLRRYLNGDIKRVDALAIMTDTDDSGRGATACYGEIYFTEK